MCALGVYAGVGVKIIIIIVVVAYYEMKAHAGSFIIRRRFSNKGQ